MDSSDGSSDGSSDSSPLKQHRKNRFRPQIKNTSGRSVTRKILDNNVILGASEGTTSAGSSNRYAINSGIQRFGDISIQQGSNITVTDNEAVTSTIVGTAFTRLNYNAGDFNSPNNANWKVNANAAAIIDPTNAALDVRRFNDSTDQGVGFLFRIPSGVTSMTFYWTTRPQTAPASSGNVIPKLYYRQIPNNGAVSTTWTGTGDGSLILNTLAYPNNTNFQYATQTVLLNTFSPDIVAGDMYQFELIRHTSSASDTLVGNWLLLNLTIVLN